MTDASPPSALRDLLSAPAEEREGILLTRPGNDPTVWDKEADADHMFAAISADSEELERLKSARQIDAIADQVTPSAILLDLGCGYGRVAKYLLPRTAIGGYIGVDSSIQMLKLFKRRYDASPEEQRTPVLWVNSDIATLPIKDAAVDIVVVSAVFLHNDKAIVRRSLDEVHRVLKPGGKLLVFASFPRRATLMGAQGALYHAMLARRGEADRNGPVRYYSKAEMGTLLRRFSRFELRGDGFTFLPKSIIGLRGLPERLFRRGFAEPVNRLVAALLPARLHPAFAVHYDVVATK